VVAADIEMESGSTCGVLPMPIDLDLLQELVGDVLWPEGHMTFRQDVRARLGRQILPQLHSRLMSLWVSVPPIGAVVWLSWESPGLR
jgi:hypothetical protein